MIECGTLLLDTQLCLDVSVTEKNPLIPQSPYHTSDHKVIHYKLKKNFTTYNFAQHNT